MEEKKTSIYNGYAICFNEWSLDKEIKNELGLLLIISSLCAEKGYCFASNEYLGDLFNLPKETISRKIKLLQEKKYITIEYDKRGCEIIGRRIRLSKLLFVDYQNCYSSINKNVKDNNISNKNISNKNNNSSSDTIFDFIENNFGRLLNPIEYEVISQWEDNELTRYAIKQAVLNSKFNVKYINTILHNYKMCGIRNVQEAEEQEKRFKNKYTKKKDELEEWLNEHEGI